MRTLSEAFCVEGYEVVHIVSVFIGHLLVFWTRGYQW
jgi:hypothetical protein